ncbi:exported protein of unknown function [Nitrosotalea devaniterrae]|uniref:Uncharacterized protein n=1 Tax=Nitrosotalea devaniterrae TaxID=1078905 RepID=A0A128A147_9ARCH|nr:exported protein of unknown function [Candidatus Nitrosotalea devanaterra]
MLKKFGIIVILFFGSLILVLGLVKTVFDMVIGITFYLHVVGGIAIIIFGVILYKKYAV